MKKTNEVSKLVGVSRRTLQYYDDEGLLKVEKSSNNHRIYFRKFGGTEAEISGEKDKKDSKSNCGIKHTNRVYFAG
ncbi:MerR family transcriptional regulator [Mediterraneibacter glycyrrhizinilyticus]|nr:MerR family transcriptional regulator [Mediterraneibacter glycyrrhizinilyticus]